MGRYRWLMILVASLLIVCGNFTNYAGAAATDDEALKKVVRELLKNEPDLILDVLRSHSEIVLDVAQQGHLERQHREQLAQWEKDMKEPKKFQYTGAMFRGSPNAPVTVTVFSDFTCAYCRKADGVLVKLLKKYDGKIRMAFKPLPNLNMDYSIKAAEYVTASLLHDNKKGWAYFDAVFAAADELEAGGETLLKALAVKNGLDAAKIEKAAKSEAVQAIIETAQKEAAAQKLRGTPSFFIENMVLRGAQGIDTLEEAIGIALRQKK